MATAAAAAKSLQSCPTLCDPRGGSPPGSPVPGILQAGTLEWVAISFSNAWKWKVKVKLFSRVWLLATPWTAAYQAPLSMGFSRQEYWSAVPLPSPSDGHYLQNKIHTWSKGPKPAPLHCSTSFLLLSSTPFCLADASKYIYATGILHFLVSLSQMLSSSWFTLCTDN